MNDYDFWAVDMMLWIYNYFSILEHLKMWMELSKSSGEIKKKTTTSSSQKTRVNQNYTNCTYLFTWIFLVLNLSEEMERTFLISCNDTVKKPSNLWCAYQNVYDEEKWRCVVSLFAFRMQLKFHSWFFFSSFPRPCHF